MNTQEILEMIKVIFICGMFVAAVSTGIVMIAKLLKWQKSLKIK